MLTQARPEQEFTRQLAEEFRGEGFQPLDPTQLRKELPPGYIPDLLLQRGDEFIVIEIKSEEEHRSIEQLRLIKQTIESRPKWQFKLYVLPRPKDADNLQDNLQDVGKLISRAKQFNRSGEFEAASVILWMAIEIALRTLLTHYQSRPNLGVSGMSMARGLLSLGELSESDLQLIEQAWRTRNLGVHGFRLIPRGPLAPELLTFAERLVERAKTEAQ
jgi:hypothetical protein